MKERFASFLVEKSRMILILFIVLAVGCGALIPFVSVNRDMTKYLPDESSMSQGLDIMRAEFGDEDSSELFVMFDDLKTDKDKDRICRELEEIKGVSSVDFEPNSDDYNRKGHTLYKLKCDHKAYSETAAGIQTAVKEKYGEDHKIALGGTIESSNKEGLPLWIAVLAVICVFLVLLIMASSWIEPVIFMITIGIAVLINMGTYVLYPEISKTTFGIVAILQLVLSMDYSIMLLNRYRQQRDMCADKKVAMKRALSLSFGAITGSSLTTFAGLLALLFMSFKVGADVGLALAKGVICSLICIFTVLPALVLGFDEMMIRLKKKTFSFDLPRLSRIQHRMRMPLTIAFMCLLAAGFVIRNGVDFSYEQYGSEGAIKDIFGYDNQIAVIYNEKDGKAAKALAEDLDEDDQGGKVKSAVCYESTIGKKRSPKDMKAFIDDMKESNDSSDTFSGDMKLSEKTLRLIYYDYYSPYPKFKLTIPQFAAYLKKEVVNDKDFGSSVKKDMKDKVKDLAKYTDTDVLTTRMGSHGLADYFGMTDSQGAQLLLYYQIISGTDSVGTLSLPSFVSFLVNDVSKDKEYGSSFSKASLNKLKSIKKYTNKKKMTTKVTYKSAAGTLGIDKSKMRLVYVYAHGKKGSSRKMTIAALAKEMQGMTADPLLAGQFAGSQMKQLTGGLAGIAQMDRGSYGAAAMAKKLKGYGIPLDGKTVNLAYAYTDVKESPGSYRHSVQQCVSLILGTKTISSSMTARQKKQLGMLKKIIDTSVGGSLLSADSMGSLLGMSPSDARKVYLLHRYKKGDTSSWGLTPQQFIKFLADKVLNDPEMKSRVSGSASDLVMARRLINSSVRGDKYTYEELKKFFEETGGDFDMKDDSIRMLYELYGSQKKYDDSWKLDLVSMVRHLDDKMKKRPSFSDAMTKKEKKDLHEMRKDLEDAGELLRGQHYGRMVITADLPEDSHETRSFMDKLSGDIKGQFKEKTYLVGSTPMAYEMSLTFQDELDRITILTALFILFIVLLTFRRMAAPVILVLIIQCAVFMTMALLNLLGIDMNYLAVLIVQSIMMGATIDYAIIYTTYYIESRGKGASSQAGEKSPEGLNPAQAIRASYRGSLQTILTSATILIVVAGLLSFAFSEPATGQICRILSVGCLMSTVLIVFILPAILAFMDRFVVGKKLLIHIEKCIDKN